MNILYLHDENELISNSHHSTLQKYCIENGYELHTPNINYTTLSVDVPQIEEQIYDRNEWLVIGSGLGGWLAYIFSREHQTKCVLINPEIEPKGFKPLVVNNLSPTLILLDSADEVIDSHNSYRMFENYAQVEIFDGGDHRFQHMQESMIYIDEMVNHVHL